MSQPATTKMSSRGQVVIPEEIRQRLGMTPGTQFLVLGEEDVVILKVLAPPALEEFDELIREARRQARSTGLRAADIRTAVAEERERG